MPKSIKRFKDKVKARKYRNNQRKINYDKGGFANILKRSVRAIQMKRWKIKKDNLGI